MSKTKNVMKLAGLCALLLSLHANAGMIEKALIAGQHTDVGTVKVSDDGNHICVQMSTEGNYKMQAVHIAVVAETDEFTTNKKGLPMIGHFSVNESFGEPQSSFETCFSMADLGLSLGDMSFVAAHAEVVELAFPPITDDDLANLMLPSQVQIIPSRPGTGFGDPSYWDVEILDSDLAGDYDGWCVDTSRTLSGNQQYTADVFSSYDQNANTMIDKPENLPEVNWLVNQDFVGQAAPGPCTGNYTMGDVQRTIWELVDDNSSTAGLGPWDACRAEQIEAAAIANGSDFVPQCGDTLAIVLKPYTSNGSLRQIIIHQILVAELPLVCDPEIVGEETAWGDGIEGTPFNPDKSWSKYFKYTIME